MLAVLATAASCGNVSAEKTLTGTDREGNPVALPQNMERIISMGPSNTEIITALGYGDKIIAIDSYSSDIEGINQGLPMFNMMSPDGEQIINLQPDVIFVTGMTKVDGGDLLKSVSDTGICIMYLPSCTSITDIKEDIRYIAKVLGAQAEGEALVAKMEDEIAKVAAIGSAITEKKAVYFEVDAPPYQVSFGRGVFLNEMLELIGAENIFRDQDSWISLTDEAVLHANPDVILTSVNYVDNPIEDIKTRPGWSEVAAVKNGEVYIIDADSSNRPSHNIVKALLEMAKAVYPSEYTDL